MDNSLSSATHGTIQLSAATPEIITDFLMNNSETKYAEGEYGRLLLRDLYVNNFVLSYDIYTIKARFELNLKYNAPALMILVALKNNIRYKFAGIGDIEFKEGEFNIIYLASTDGTAQFEKKGKYKIFTLFFPVSLLQRYTEVFSSLYEFFKKINKSSPALLFEKNGTINYDMQYIVNRLLQCNDEEKVRTLRYENLVKELLLLFLLEKE